MSNVILDYSLRVNGELQAISKLKSVSGRSEELGKALDGAESSARDATEAISSIDSSAITKTADEAKRATGELRKMGDEAALSNRQIKQLVMMGGMAALKIGGAALDAYGHEREGKLLQSMGGNALQFGMAGGMMFGPKGAIGGAAIGLASGAAEHYFGGMERVGSDDYIKRAFANNQDLSIQREMSMRTLGRMGVGNIGGLESSITGMHDKLRELQLRTEKGLIPKEMTEDTLHEMDKLQLAISLATDRLKELRKVERNKNLDEEARERFEKHTADRLAENEKIMMKRRSDAMDWVNQQSALRGIESLDYSGSAERGLKNLKEQQTRIIQLRSTRTLTEEEEKSTSQTLKNIREQIAALETKHGVLIKNEEIAKAEKEAEAENDRRVMEAIGLLNAPNDRRVDELSAKGFGSIGASATAGLENLAKEGNGFLKTIAEAVGRGSGLGFGGEAVWA